MLEELTNGNRRARLGKIATKVHIDGVVNLYINSRHKALPKLSISKGLILEQIQGNGILHLEMFNYRVNP